MSSKLDQAMQFNETSLRLREQRQQILASNIANADTPNFKARDIDFGKALQSAMASGSEAPALATTAANHIATGGSGGGIAPLMYRTPNQASIDGNTVEMDNERNQFTDNSLRYEASLTMLSTQIKGLLSAIQG